MASAQQVKKELSELLMPVAIAVATRAVLDKTGKSSDVPIVSDSFIAEQMASANAIFGEFKLGFVSAKPRRALAERHLQLEDRADRNQLVDAMLPGVVNIFFVESLRDVDDPKLHRMGVTWRNLANLKKKYVIVAASARETTTAHELGHFFGNDHAFVKNNLMSYDRDGGKVFLDAKQAAKARRTALALFASKELEKI